jgi:hypothetical protein
LLTARVTDRTCVRGLVRQSCRQHPAPGPSSDGRFLARAPSRRNRRRRHREKDVEDAASSRAFGADARPRGIRDARSFHRGRSGVVVVPRNKRSQRRRGIASESDATARTPCRRWKCGFGWWRASTSVRARFPPRRSRDRAIHRPRRSLARSRDDDDVDVLASRERERRARIRVVVALLFSTPRDRASPPPPPLSSFLRARVAERPPRAQPPPPSDRRRAQDR